MPRRSEAARFGFPHTRALAAAALVAVACSLGTDAVLVAGATRLFPADADYGHFQVLDYGTLTVLGVLAACIAWPIVVGISDAPRARFFRLAVVVTAIGLLPDVYLLADHQPIRAVGVLACMHLVIALITFNSLVRIAPPRAVGPVNAAPPREERSSDVDPASHAELGARHLAQLLAVLVAAEFALGVATLVLVPLGRPTAWRPQVGAGVYLAHAALGAPLAMGALAMLVRARGSSRILVLAARIGAGGVAISAVGGILAVFHPLRIVGVLLMLVGPAVAGFGYLLPTIERLDDRAASSGAH